MCFKLVNRNPNISNTNFMTIYGSMASSQVLTHLWVFHNHEGLKCTFKKTAYCFGNGWIQWRSQVIGIGRAPAVRQTIALTTLALARTYTQQTLAGHVPGQAWPLIFYLGPVLT